VRWWRASRGSGCAGSRCSCSVRCPTSKVTFPARGTESRTAVADPLASLAVAAVLWRGRLAGGHCRKRALGGCVPDLAGRHQRDPGQLQPAACLRGRGGRVLRAGLWRVLRDRVRRPCGGAGGCKVARYRLSVAGLLLSAGCPVPDESARRQSIRPVRFSCRPSGPKRAEFARQNQPGRLTPCASAPIDTSTRAKPRRSQATSGPDQVARSPLERRRGPTWTTTCTLILCHSIRPAQVKPPWRADLSGAGH